MYSACVPKNQFNRDSLNKYIELLMVINDSYKCTGTPTNNF